MASRRNIRALMYKIGKQEQTEWIFSLIFVKIAEHFTLRHSA